MKKQTRFSLWYFVSIFFLIMLLQSLFFPGTGSRRELTYTAFRDMVRNKQVAHAVVLADRILGECAMKDGKAPAQCSIESAPTAPWRLKLKEVEEKTARQFTVVRLPNVDEASLFRELDAAGVTYSGRIENNFFRNFLLNWIFPIVFIIILWGFLFRRMGSAGRGMMAFGKNRPVLVADDPAKRVGFSDVAGVDEAVEEVGELVDFLKNPKKFTVLGGKLPKGVLLVGPPGTGKTLLARAVAGEAGVPFFSMSGSEFVEMFVGVGAARVRDLFNQAKQKSPCIIFIDEIDAIGKSRAQTASISGGYDERENTLNQLLVEMDGFDPGAGVIIMGATNRPEVLDHALLRPGRFDRQVLVDRPDMKGRAAIFAVHTRTLALARDVDLKRLASQTPGFAGAEIANVCNEAALLGARRGVERIGMREFEEAIERIIAGLEKKNKLINEKERRIVAYHEAGHAITGYFTPGADVVQKVSIVPRGLGALGYTMQMPLEDRYLMSRSELLGKIKGLLAGRAAEDIAFGEISTGASNDLEKVAQIARSMVTVYGMSSRMPNLSLAAQSRQGFIWGGMPAERRSEKIEQAVDDEVMEIINRCYQETKDLLSGKRALLDSMAAALLEKETLGHDDIRALLGDRTVS